LCSEKHAGLVGAKIKAKTLCSLHRVIRDARVGFLPPPIAVGLDNLSTVSDRVTTPLISTKIPKARFAYRQLFGSPFSLAMLERSRLHQKRQVGGA